MIKRIILPALLIIFIANSVHAQKILVPMDLKQTNHLKAYGAAFWTLERGINIEWLLNYRGGAFLINYTGAVERELRVRGGS